ncbi:hypothetical protein CBR_g36327 [Chara braunii]|uniref:Reverse transcriptase/retrotransposon-derived protein RNase H-like domain-containing protein n=1 Tax=Chara braunii TaxID=69332 RepID=A0A388LKD7_CHABU|nr:hypothetical protein CBR_g36327 [Chara braunii]|eukprot:GBG82796.1 hypothetical protein CBR_g36327 [Chara braunii]
MTGPYVVESRPSPSGTSAATLSQNVASSSSGPVAGATPQLPPVSPAGQQLPWYPKTPMKPPPTSLGDKKDEALDTWLRTVPLWVRANRTLVEEEVITAASYLEGSTARWLNELVASKGFGRNMGDWAQTYTRESFMDLVEARWHNPQQAQIATDGLLKLDARKPFVVTTDASQYDICAVLAHQEGEKFRPIEYMSKMMPSKTLAKSTYERELYAFYKALVHWRRYALGRYLEDEAGAMALQDAAPASTAADSPSRDVRGSGPQGEKGTAVAGVTEDNPSGAEWAGGMQGGEGENQKEVGTAVEGSSFDDGRRQSQAMATAGSSFDDGRRAMAVPGDGDDGCADVAGMMVYDRSVGGSEETWACVDPEAQQQVVRAAASFAETANAQFPILQKDGTWRGIMQERVTETLAALAYLLESTYHDIRAKAVAVCAQLFAPFLLTSSVSHQPLSTSPLSELIWQSQELKAACERMIRPLLRLIGNSESIVAANSVRTLRAIVARSGLGGRKTRDAVGKGGGGVSLQGLHVSATSTAPRVEMGSVGKGGTNIGRSLANKSPLGEALASVQGFDIIYRQLAGRVSSKKAERTGTELCIECLILLAAIVGRLVDTEWAEEVREGTDRIVRSSHRNWGKLIVLLCRDEDTDVAVAARVACAELASASEIFADFLLERQEGLLATLLRGLESPMLVAKERTLHLITSLAGRPIFSTTVGEETAICKLSRGCVSALSHSTTTSSKPAGTSTAFADRLLLALKPRDPRPCSESLMREALRSICALLRWRWLFRASLLSAGLVNVLQGIIRQGGGVHSTGSSGDTASTVNEEGGGGSRRRVGGGHATSRCQHSQVWPQLWRTVAWLGLSAEGGGPAGKGLRQDTRVNERKAAESQELELGALPDLLW